MYGHLKHFDFPSYSYFLFRLMSGQEDDVPGVAGVEEPAVQPGAAPHEHECLCHGINHMSARPKKWRCEQYPYRLREVSRDHEWSTEINGHIADIRKYRMLIANRAANYKNDCIADQLDRERRERELSTLKVNSDLTGRQRHGLILSERIAGQVAAVKALARGVQSAEVDRESAFAAAFDCAHKGDLVAGFENLRGIKEQRVYDGCKRVASNEKLELEELEYFNYTHLYHQVYFLYIDGAVKELKKRLGHEREELTRIRIEQARFHGDLEIEATELDSSRRSSQSQ